MPQEESKSRRCSVWHRQECRCHTFSSRYPHSQIPRQSCNINHATLMNRRTPVKRQEKILEEILQSAQWKVGAVKARQSPAMAERLSDDQELLRQLAKGNEDAFRTLYERYQGRIYRFALHMSGNPATGEETTQEVFLALMAKPKAYDPAKGSLASYLFGMARNIARRAIKETAADVPLEDDSERDEFAVADGLDVLEELTNGELLAALRQAVLTLPEPYREVVE